MKRTPSRYPINQPIPPASGYEPETACALRTIGVLLLVLAFILIAVKLVMP